MQRILVEGPSRKSAEEHTGRTDQNKTVVFPYSGETAGECVDVVIDRVNSATLFGHRQLESVGVGEERAA